MQEKEISLRSLNKIAVTQKGTAIERAFKLEHDLPLTRQQRRKQEREEKKIK